MMTEASPSRPKLAAFRVAQALRGSPCASLAAFVAGGLAALALFYGALGTLRMLDRLPAPPVSGTWCIDSRFAWLRDVPAWKDAVLVAVGSSTTWHNLNFAVAPAEMKERGMVNAAPCFLRINQTRYLVEFLLDRAPRAKTVLTVLTLRDLEGCSRSPTAFFDPEVADPYIDGRSYAWLLYFRNFRFTDVALHAIYADERRTQMQYDAFGSSFLARQVPELGHRMNPEANCFMELRRLAGVLEARGVEFIVVTFPVMRAWAERYDVHGLAQAGFRAGVETALASTKAIVVDGMVEWPAPDTAFADPIHLQWHATADFTRFVWEAARQQGASLPSSRDDRADHFEAGVSQKTTASARDPGLADR